MQGANWIGKVIIFNYKLAKIAHTDLLQLKNEIQ